MQEYKRYGKYISEYLVVVVEMPVISRSKLQSTYDTSYQCKLFIIPCYFYHDISISSFSLAPYQEKNIMEFYNSIENQFRKVYGKKLYEACRQDIKFDLEDINYALHNSFKNNLLPSEIDLTDLHKTILSERVAKRRQDELVLTGNTSNIRQSTDNYHEVDNEETNLSKSFSAQCRNDQHTTHCNKVVDKIQEFIVQTNRKSIDDVFQDILNQFFTKIPGSDVYVYSPVQKINKNSLMDIFEEMPQESVFFKISAFFLDPKGNSKEIDDPSYS